VGWACGDREIRSAYKILAEKPLGKYIFEKLEGDGKIILR
jgi:hypothetical protein